MRPLIYLLLIIGSNLSLQAQTIFVNSGFENGLTGWNPAFLNAAVLAPQEGLNGSTAIKISTQGNRIYQVASLAPSIASMTFSYYVKAESGASVGVRSKFFNTAWQQIAIIDSVITPGLSYQTTPITKVLTRPANAQYIEVSLVKYSGTGSVYFDQVSLLSGGLADPCNPDLIAPVITSCPADIIVETADDFAQVTWIRPTATDNCAPPLVIGSSGWESPAHMPVGTHEVIFTAYDGFQSVQCEFTVTVRKNPCLNDQEPPIFTVCPPSVSIITNQDSVTLNSGILASASDLCSQVSLTSNLPLFNAYQAKFGLGTTQVVYTATDVAGNSAECSFNVHVISDTNCPDNLLIDPNATATGVRSSFWPDAGWIPHNAGNGTYSNYDPFRMDIALAGCAPEITHMKQIVKPVPIKTYQLSGQLENAYIGIRLYDFNWNVLAIVGPYLNTQVQNGSVSITIPANCAWAELRYDRIDPNDCFSVENLCFAELQNTSTCNITATVSNISCDNGLLPGDEDDTFSFDVEVNKTGAGCGTSWTGGGKTGNYGQITTFGPYLKVDGPRNITFTDTNMPQSSANIFSVFSNQTCYGLGTVPDLKLTIETDKTQPGIWNEVLVTYKLTNNSTATYNSVSVKIPSVYDAGFGSQMAIISSTLGSTSNAWTGNLTFIDLGPNSNRTFSVKYYTKSNQPIQVFAQVISGLPNTDANATFDNNTTGIPTEDDEALLTLNGTQALQSSPKPYAAPEAFGAVRLYPNPATQTATIDLSVLEGAPTSIQIFDAFGKSQFAASSSAPTVELDLTDWQSGIYLVRLETEGMRARTLKLVVVGL